MIYLQRGSYVPKSLEALPRECPKNAAPALGWPA